MYDKLPHDTRAMGMTSAYGSWEKFNSGARTAMEVSMMSQAVKPMFPELPHTLGGYEVQLAKYTMSVAMPDNGEIIQVIPKYMIGQGQWSIQQNSMKTIIFYNDRTGKLDVLDIEYTFKTHDTFIHTFKEEQRTRMLSPGNTVGKGTMLARTNSVLDVKDYSGKVLPQKMFSQTLNANFAFLSHASVIEDGMLINSAWLKRATPRAGTILTGEWGKTHYPVNTYGDLEHYRPHGGPGEEIRKDGIVMAMRKHDKIFDAINMLPEQLMTIDHIHDKKIYCPPDAVGAVIDDVDVITTTKDRPARNNITPLGMEAYSQVFVSQMKRYYETILDVVEGYQRKNRRVELSARLHARVVEAYGDEPRSQRSRYGMDGRTNSVQRVMRGIDVDEWLVRIKLSWDFEIDNGGKFSGMSGNKGVACRIMEPEDMPTDEQGNICDIAVYGPGCVARLNPGQLYEQMKGACDREIRHNIVRMVGGGDYAGAWEHYIQYQRLVGPDTSVPLEGLTPLERKAELDNIIMDKIYATIPDDNVYVGTKWMRALHTFAKPHKSPVTFRNFDGTMRTTRKPVTIGQVQIMTLDKLSFKPMSVAVSLLNNFGLPSTQNKATKLNSPISKQAPRVYAEDEMRSMTAVMGGGKVMDQIELSTNPEATIAAVEKMYNSDTPMSERALIDRSKIKRGSGRNVQFVKHILSISGIGIADSK